MKVYISVCVLAVIAILLHGHVEGAPLQLLDTQTLTIDDEEHDQYVMFNLLEKALTNNSFNRYKLRTTFFSGDLVLCLPVLYQLECMEESNSSLNENCTSGYSVPFLWTYFDVETFAGKVLLFFTKNHLKSPLVTISHKFCSYSLSTCGLTIYLQIESLPQLKSNISMESLISHTLLQISAKVSPCMYSLIIKFST